MQTDTSAQKSNPSSTDRAAVAAALARLSAAWQNRKYDALAEMFDEHVVMVLPGLSGRVEGRDVLVGSYREFVERVTLTQVEESPPMIDVWGDTALTVCAWTMTWFADNISNHAAGHELFVFRRAQTGDGSSSWRAVWRTMIVDPNEA